MYYKGRKHRIRKFRNKELLFEQLKLRQISNVFLDIDLDYFTIENSSANDRHFFTDEDKEEIRDTFSLEGDFMKWIFQRLEGFTLALEPKHTGGISKSLSLTDFEQEELQLRFPKVMELIMDLGKYQNRPIV